MEGTQVAPPAAKVGNLAQRVLSAVIAIPILVIVIWFGEPWFSVVVVVVAVIAALEFYTLADQTDATPLVTVGLLGTIGTILLVSLRGPISIPLAVFGLVSLVSLPLVYLLVRRYPFRSWLWTWGAVWYIGACMAFIVLTRQLDKGREWVLLTMLTVFAADTGAYVVGRAMGRRKLWPQVSPGKTWEGALGGLAWAIVVSLVLYLLLDLPGPATHAIALGAIAGVLGPVGDLWESYLKRKAGVKDTGNLIPGHGGMLDRLDSIVLTFVAVYYYISVMIL